MTAISCRVDLDREKVDRWLSEAMRLLERRALGKELTLDGC